MVKNNQNEEEININSNIISNIPNIAIFAKLTIGTRTSSSTSNHPCPEAVRLANERKI